MKNTVTMAELMKKVTAYGQPQNLDEGFASDAQRRAAFASGYKEKGKKDKKEETLGEIKLSPPMIAKIKKTFEPLRDKKIGPSTQNKLMQTMDKIDKDKQTLVDLMNADIPFVSKLAVARLISKHNMKADQINKLRKEEVELDEKVDMQTKSYINDIVSAINRNPKLKYMKPFAKKFKDLAMKTGDVKKSLEAAMPDYIAGADIMRLLNMGEETELVEKDIKILVKDVKDRNFLKDLLNKAKDEKVMVGSPTPADRKAGKYVFVGPKDKVNNVFNYAFDKSINRGNYAPATMMHEETGEIYERFSPKEIKMAIGIASDPRYAKGNMTGAVKAIEKMKRGLSDHPQVAAVLKRQNEDLDLVNAAANVLGEKLDKEDEPKVKKIIGKLKKASDAHAGQAKDLEKAISEDGHTDVASAIRQCKTIVEDATQMMPKLQSMNPEDALPTWWTNKLAVASNSMNKLRDYFLVPTSESLEDELDEMKEPFVVVDTADGNKVVGTASNEKEAKSIITSAELPPMKIKDKKTLKIMKSKKKQMIGQPFKEEVELDEQLDYIVVDKDNKIITRQKNKVDAKEFEKFANSKSYKKPLKKPTKVLPIRSTDKKKIGDTVIGIGMEEVELDEKYDLYHKDFSSAMQHAYDYAKKKMGITVDPKEIDSKVATGPKKPSEGKTNKYRLKGKGGNLQIQVYNKGGSKPFELNMYKEESESMNDIKEWFTKNKCDVKVREIHEGSNVYQAYVPISKTIPNNLRYLTLENQYGMIPEDVENLDDINYKNIKETSITMNGDFWNKLLTAYEEK